MQIGQEGAPYIPTNSVHDTLGARGCLLPAGTPMVPGGLARSQDRSREGNTLDGPIPAVAGSDKGPPLVVPSPRPPGYNLCTHKSPLSLPPGNRAGCLVSGEPHGDFVREGGGVSSSGHSLIPCNSRSQRPRTQSWRSPSLFLEKLTPPQCGGGPDSETLTPKGHRRRSSRRPWPHIPVADLRVQGHSPTP